MKKSNLITILSALILSANAYADWPTAFKLCNHSHGDYKVNLSNFHNIAWRVGDNIDWMKTTEFQIPAHQCKEIFIKTNEHGYSQYSSFKIDYEGTRGHASFFLKTDPNDIKHLEPNVAHWTMNTWWANNDNMKIEARVSKIARCQNGTCHKVSSNRLDTWIISENTNNKYSDGTYKFYPPHNENIQTINLLQSPTNPEDYTTEEKALLAAVYKNLKTLIPKWDKTHDTGSLDLTIRRNDGNQIDLWSAGAICRLYDPYINLDYAAVTLEQAPITSFKSSTLAPLAVLQEHYNNKSESVTRFRTLEFATTTTKSFTDTTKNTITFKNTLSIGTVVKIPAVSETSKTLSMEMEVSKSKLVLSEKQTNETIAIPSRMLEVPAKSNTLLTSNLSREKISGKVYASYPFDDYNISGDYALNGNCRNKSSNNIVPVKIRLTLLAQQSIEPDKFGVSKAGKLSLRDAYEFTTELGFAYTSKLAVTPMAQDAKPYEIIESVPYYISDKISAATAKDYVKPLQ